MQTKIRKPIGILLSLVMLLSVFAGLHALPAAQAYSAGDTIQFGTYPQSQVTDETLIAALDTADKVWASYGYYSGTGDESDGLMQPGDWMQFADFFYGGEKYRAVTFSQFRPLVVGRKNLSSSMQQTNNYKKNTVYYFRYEPLTWRVLDPSTGFVLSERSVDAQPFNNTIYKDPNTYGMIFYQAIGSSVYANDYATSSIRSWLNADFYDTAFSESQKANIQTTALNNDSFDPENFPQYNSAPTNDKIFLLSDSDAKSNVYFSNDWRSRIALGTAYAACQGVAGKTSSTRWLLRASYNQSNMVECVKDGAYDNVSRTDSTSNGIRPACRLFELGADVAASETLYSCARNGHAYGDSGDARFTCTVCGHVDDELKAAAELPDVKAAAKEELENYKNAADYRADGQAALAAAIADGEAAIDAAADPEAVAAALNAAKAAVDAIKTDAQLAAEEAGETPTVGGKIHGEHCFCYDYAGDGLFVNIVRFICAVMCFILSVQTALGV